MQNNADYPADDEDLDQVVFIGSDGADEGIAIERATGNVLLVPWIGSKADWILLGRDLTEAFGRFERDDVLDEAVHPYGG